MTDTKTPAAALDEMLAIVEKLPLPELARLAAHEYDEECVTPEPDSAGAQFLESARDVFVAAGRLRGRFPDPETDPEATTNWWGEVSGTMVAQAFVDLGLYYSHHADAASGATVYQLQRVLISASEHFAATLWSEYGPLV
jgi:hypothetical protein